MVEITILKRSHDEAVVTQRKFFKKTAKGKVIKGMFGFPRCYSIFKSIAVLRERYLRDDVSCGIADCSECDNIGGEVLKSNGDSTHSMFPTGHFILPDTNIFLSQVRPPHRPKFLGSQNDTECQMDLIESANFNPPILLLQTVMEEVRHRSLPLFNRLRALTKTEGKKVWVFYNEYRS